MEKRKAAMFWALLAGLTLLAILILLAAVPSAYRLRRGGRPGVSTLDPKNYVKDPAADGQASIYEPQPNRIEASKPEWLGREVRNAINSDSLHEPREYSVEKPSGTFRIAAIGDSWTYGMNVDTEKNWTEILEARLNEELAPRKFEVINLGVPGYDLEYALERFRRRGAKYDPDLVIWLVTPIDFMKVNRLMAPIREELKSQGVPEFDPETKTYPILMKTMERFSKMYDEGFVLQDQRRTLAQGVAEIRCGALILSSPNLPGASQELIRSTIGGNPRFRYFSGLSDLSSEPALRLADGHPNEEGHLRLAQEIAASLEANELRRP